MPRGGRRENAGKKSRWDSGRTFAETKVIRVPIEFAEQLLDVARRLDAGESIEIVTNSGRATEEIESLTNLVNSLQERVNQLEAQLSSSSLKRKRDSALARLSMGKAAARYKDASKVLDAFIENLTQ
jgi:TusA-related sulfurtransferase